MSKASAPAAEHDPVTTALNDAAVRTRLFHAARAFLLSSPGIPSTTQRLSETEDVVQIAALRAWQRRGDYHAELGGVVGWLVGFVRNVARERSKPNKAGAVAAPPMLDDLAADLGRAASDTTADKLLVAQLLDQLPPPDRQLIRLRFDEGLSCAEVADRLGGNENAVRVRLFRLIAQLRERCAGLGVTEL